MSILFVTRHYSESFFPLIEELANVLPVSYAYFSENDREYNRNGIEIREIDEYNPSRLNDFIEKINPTITIFSSPALANEFIEISSKKGVIINDFASSKTVSDFDFVVTFFSTLEKFYKEYTDVIKINPFIDLEKIENLRKQRLSRLREMSNVYSFMVFSEDISDEFQNLIGVIEKIRSSGVGTSVNVITGEQALTHISHISFIQRPIEENRLLSLLMLSDASFFITQNVFDFVRAYSTGVCPIVSSRTFLFEYIWNGKTGFVISFDDKHAIEDAIKKCIDRLPTITKRLQKDASMFNVKNVAKDLAEQLARKNFIEGIEI